MLSVLKGCISPSILRHGTLPHLPSISTAITLAQVRTLRTNSTTKDTGYLPNSQRDGNWGYVHNYANRQQPEKKTPDEIWRAWSKNLETNPPPGVYAGLFTKLSIPNSANFLIQRPQCPSERRRTPQGHEILAESAERQQSPANVEVPDAPREERCEEEKT